MAETRFIIRVGDVYYVTSGDLMVFDPAKAATDQDRDSVASVAAQFKEAASQKDGVYEAVMLTDDAYSATNFSDE